MHGVLSDPNSKYEHGLNYNWPKLWNGLTSIITLTELSKSLESSKKSQAPFTQPRCSLTGNWLLIGTVSLQNKTIKRWASEQWFKSTVVGLKIQQALYLELADMPRGL